MLESKNIRGVLVVSFKEQKRLNALIADAVKEYLLEFFNKPNSRVIFDLRGISFIDSTGFNVLLAAMKAANNNSGQFKICHVNPEVMELFKLLQLQHVFEIYDELEPCLDSFNQ
jgi:anti-sigma B factor antagonist